MKKWILRLLYTALVLLPVGAIADYTATTGAGSTVFAFVCSTTKICPATVLIDSSNVEKATSGNPLRTDPTGTTAQPVSAAANAYAAGSLAIGAGVDGWDITEGVTTDVAATAGSAGTVSAKLRLMTTQLNTINTTLNAPMQNSGGSVTANIGTAGTLSTAANQTSELTKLDTIITNTGSAIPAGSNTIGNVGGVSASPVVSAATEGTHILKASAGNLFSLTTTIGATTGWLMIFDATSAPVDGAVTPKLCRYIKSDGTGGANSLAWANPLVFATGISVAFSSTGCFTKTASATAFFAGQVQ